MDINGIWRMGQTDFGALSASEQVYWQYLALKRGDPAIFKLSDNDLKAMWVAGRNLTPGTVNDMRPYFEANRGKPEVLIQLLRIATRWEQMSCTSNGVSYEMKKEAKAEFEKELKPLLPTTPAAITALAELYRASKW